MRRSRISRIACLIVVILIACLAAVAWGSDGGAGATPDRIGELVERCGHVDESSAVQAIIELRALGQPAVDALCAEHDRSMHPPKDFSHNPAERVAPEPIAAGSQAANDERLARLRRAIDAVARQRDAHVSRLFWHTDLETAQSEAGRTGRPILSLRLLGNLDEDLSCANSRFFRSVLYANQEVSGYLRDHFVLHWQSLRPVPRLTIDFGDGRRIERTITGNSIHYVLDSRGELIDGIPGLYGPSAFLRALQAAENVSKFAGTISDDAARDQFVREHHAGAIAAIDWALQRDFASLNLPLPPPAAPAPAGPAGELLVIPAAELARSKMGVERKAIEAAIELPGALARRAWLIDDAQWERIAALHAGDAALDQASVTLITTKLPADLAQQAQNLTQSKSEVETPALRALRTFQQSLAIDTVRNEHQLHRAIHQWLADGAGRADIDSFNRRVYAELFLTPLDDPWMGLAPADAYAALDGGGLIDACD